MKFFATLSFALLTACTALDTGDDSLASRGGGSACPSSGLTCAADADCAADEECEDGACKRHGGACDGTSDDGPGDDGGSGDDDGPGAGQCTLDADCGAGLECEDGACVPHGG